MARIFLLTIFLFVLASPGAAGAAEDCAYRPQQGSPITLKRGVNLSKWWEDAVSGALKPDEVKGVRALGFDFVRLPVSPKWLEIDDAEEQERKLAQLRCDVVSLLNENLAVIVDLHPSGGFKQDLMDHPDRAGARLEALWRRLQPVAAGLPPDRVFIGLYNEPGIETGSWWDIQGRLIGNLRPLFPRNTFIAIAGADAGPWDLLNVKPYADKNVIYDFHFYLPLFFTHHGADWLGFYRPGQKTSPAVYPVVKGASFNEDDPAARQYAEEGWNRPRLARHIRRIAAWRDRNHVRIACLEFGVYRPYVGERSRHNWLRDVRELFENAGIPWALWEYSGVFGLLDLRERLDEGMVTALGLIHNRAP